jgi:hypothetical protein
MMVYLPPDAGPFAQGDVIDGCPVPLLPESAEDVLAGVGVKLAPARVVVLTQTCDLVQFKAARVVVGIVYPAPDVVQCGGLKATAIRDQVRLGKMYGWYFLPAASEPLSFPESLVDLRDLHTFPVAVLHYLVATGKRVCRLAVPSREHLAQHFAVTYMRIALPEPYPTDP